MVGVEARWSDGVDRLSKALDEGRDGGVGSWMDVEFSTWGMMI